MRKLLIILFLFPALAFAQTPVVLSFTKGTTQTNKLDTLLFTYPGNAGGARTLAPMEFIRSLFKLKSDSVNNSGYVTHGYFNAHNGGGGAFWPLAGVGSLTGPTFINVGNNTLIIGSAGGRGGNILFENSADTTSANIGMGNIGALFTGSTGFSHNGIAAITIRRQSDNAQQGFFIGGDTIATNVTLKTTFHNGINNKPAYYDASIDTAEITADPFALIDKQWFDAHNGGGGSMIYPGSGIPVSTGSAWGTSITDNHTNWNTAFTQTRQWNGGATGLVAATGRTSLGLDAIYAPIFTATPPLHLTSNVLTIDAASTSQGGYITSGTQTIHGVKSFDNAIQGFDQVGSIRNGIATTHTNGLSVTNLANASSGTPIQYSPLMTYTGHIWNTSGTPADNEMDMHTELRGVSGTSPLLQLYWSSMLLSGSSIDRMKLDGNGQLSLLTGSYYANFLDGTPGIDSPLVSTGGIIHKISPTYYGTGGGGGSPGGSNTQVQYNNSGAFGGITGATTNGTALTLVAPVLGTPASVTLTNGTGLPLSTGVTGTLQAAQFPILTGDITTPGTSLVTTLKNTGTAGTYGQVTTDAQGRVSAGTVITDGAHGGTGVANTSKTITLGGNLTTSGAFATTFTSTATTAVTLPTTGTLSTLAGTETLTNKTLTSPTLTTPALGTPSSLVGTNITGTGASFTAGNATKLATARNIAGNSFDGSADRTFANKFIVQGTTDAGLTAAQFLGALGTGIVKNTTTTGVLSIAAGSDLNTTFGTQTANTVYSGPGSGSAATPIFRALVTADMPLFYFDSGIFSGAGTSGSPVTVISGTYAPGTLITGTPTIVAGTGAGTSPTVTVTSNGNGLKVTVVTGTLPTGTNATVATVTLANALSYTPYPVFSSGSASTSLLSGASMIYMTSTGTANVTITSGTTALTAATTYVWNIKL